MKKTVVLYGLTLAIIIILLKILEYRYLLHDLSLEIYLSIIAFIFTTIGVWSGLKIFKRKTSYKSEQVGDAVSFEQIKNLHISDRETEVLNLMANGLSNQQITDTLFISLATVKSHSTNIFNKLNVKRRTQAIQKARNLKIIV